MTRHLGRGRSLATGHNHTSAGRRFLGSLDPTTLFMGLQHRIGHDLRAEAVVEVGGRTALLTNGRNEFPYQVIAEHDRRLAFIWIAWTPRGWQAFPGDIGGGKIPPGLAQQNPARIVQTVDGRSLTAVDLRPLMAKTVQPISIGQRRSFPYTKGTAFKLAD